MTIIEILFAVSGWLLFVLGVTGYLIFKYGGGEIEQTVGSLFTMVVGIALTQAAMRLRD